MCCPTVWQVFNGDIIIVMAAGANDTGDVRFISVNVLGIDCLPPTQQQRGKERQLAEGWMLSQSGDHVK